MSDTIEEKRDRAVDDVEEIINEIEEQTGQRLGYIRRNTNGARFELTEIGEYNYNVRLALHQLRRYVDTNEELTDKDSLLQQIAEISETLEDRAELPSPDEITR